MRIDGPKITGSLVLGNAKLADLSALATVYAPAAAITQALFSSVGSHLSALS